MAVDLNATIVADASKEMTAGVTKTETTVPTVAIGIAPNAETTTLLSDKNATDAVSHAVTAAEDGPTTVDSKVENNGPLDLNETIVKTTARMAIGIALNATMITSLGEPNATSAVHQRLAAVKDDHPAETIEDRSTTVTIEVVTDKVATDEVEKHSTTTIGIALNATTPISHSDKSAIDVGFHEAVAKVGHHDAMTVAVAIHEAEAVTVAEASEAATAAVLMTVVEVTDNLAVISAATEAVTTDVVRQESHGNHENSANPKARARAMPTTAHHAT